jgi:hypothetical protein
MNNDMVFHDTSRGAVNEEVLIVDRRNGDDDCAVSQDAKRNNELTHSDSPKREENKEAMVFFCTKFRGMFSHVRYILYYVEDDTVALYSSIDCK